MKSAYTKPAYLRGCCVGSAKLRVTGKKCQKHGSCQEETLPVSRRNNQFCLSLLGLCNSVYNCLSFSSPSSPFSFKKCINNLGSNGIPLQ